MNGFQVWRWIGRWMISPLWGLECGGTRSADIVTNTLTIATKPGRISKGQRNGTRSLRLNRRSSCQRCLSTSVYPTDNYLSLAINCRRSDNADGLPADEWRWTRASLTVLESIALDAWVCAFCGIMGANRTGAVRWEDAPGDFMWMVPPLLQPRFLRWNKFFSAASHTTYCHTAVREQMCIMGHLFKRTATM